MGLWTELDRLNAPSSGNFDFAGLSLGAFSAIEIVCSELTVTSDDSEIWLRFSVGGVLITTGYRYAILAISTGQNFFGDGTTTGSALRLCSDSSTDGVGNAAGESFSSIIRVDNPASTTHYKKASYLSHLTVPSGARHTHLGMGFMENVGAIDGIRILGESTLLSGNVRLYGIT